MTELVFAATQMACDWDKEGNLDRAEKLVREAATKGAQVNLLQELFETPYFCKDQGERHLSLAAELGVVLPISLFERSNNRLEKAVNGE